MLEKNRKLLKWIERKQFSSTGIYLEYISGIYRICTVLEYGLAYICEIIFQYISGIFQYISSIFQYISIYFRYISGIFQYISGIFQLYDHMTKKKEHRSGI